MTIATIIIPVGPAHGATGIFHEAVASAEAQTLPVEIIVQHDREGRGAAWARNQAMRKVKSPFVVFLDADDLLDPEFVEKTAHWYKPGHYVYTDYRVNGKLIEVPAILNIWKVGQQHITPTLLPTAAWHSVGGFDETLDTLEDEDFYRKLHAYCWCAVRCPGAYIDYRRDKGNSLVNQDRVDYDVVWKRVQEKAALFAGRYDRFMGKCGKCGDQVAQTMPAQSAGDAPGPNMVLAQALYSPMKKTGPVSGRMYPRKGLGAVMWVDMDDAAARPDWWRKVAENPVQRSPEIETIRRMVNEAKAQARMAGAQRQQLRERQAQQAAADYEALTMQELRAEVHKRGLAVTARRKAELVEALQQADGVVA